MKKLIILALASLCVFEANAQIWDQKLKVAATDRAPADDYGFSVSISGDYAIVGARYDDEDALGSNTISDAGSAYIYERDTGNNWTQVQKIVASDRAVNDYFGFSVAISGDYAIVAAPYEDHDAAGGNLRSEAGSAYIFERDSAGNWIQAQKIVASDRATGDVFGWSVSISGNYALLGAFLESEDDTGGNFLLSAGSAYIFQRDSLGTWSEVNKIVASDREADDDFGLFVSISGEYAIVGASSEDEDLLGADSLKSAGSAYLYERDSSGNWLQVQKIVASDRAIDDYFGESVAISGGYAIVGARLDDHDASGADSINGAGSAYLFERDGAGTWNEVQKVVAFDRASFDVFGLSVAISGDLALVGATLEDEDASGSNTLGSSGSAYLYQRDGAGNWNQVQKMVSADRGANDRFSISMSISGNYILIGSHFDDEDSAGANFMSNSGSAYFFEPSCNSVDTITPIVCDSFTSPSGNYTWDSTGTYLDTLPNSAGCDSLITVNLTINSSSADSADITACNSYLSPSTNYIWTTSGTYADTILNSTGCDSAITITLTINSVDNAVTDSGITFTANAMGAMYQWLDCDNSYAPLAGETNRSFIASMPGSYAVEVSENGCVDTSVCFLVSGISDELKEKLILYPNPTDGKVHLDLGRMYKDVQITLSNTIGQIVLTRYFEATKEVDLELVGPKGVFLLEIKTEKSSAMIKVMKE